MEQDEGRQARIENYHGENIMRQNIRDDELEYPMSLQNYGRLSKT